MTSSTASNPTATGPRPPVTVVVATVLTGLAGAVGAAGLVYFALFLPADVYPTVGSPQAVTFAAVGLLLAVTALASLPGLWHGRRTAWHLLTCYVAAQAYFSCYKVFVEGEIDSVVFLTVNLVVAVLLLLPATRRHVSGTAAP